MAFAITDGRPEFAPVSEYYGFFPQEITKSGACRVALPVISLEPRTFQGLAYALNTYAYQRNDRDAVLVAHGHTDTQRGADGLGLPLNELTTMLATEDAFKDLEQMLNHRSDYQAIGGAAEAKFRTHTQTSQERTAPIQMGAGALEQVFNTLVLVRHREMNRLDIRACNLGLNPTALATLGRLLGVKFISAPNTHMFWVRVHAGTRMTGPGFNQWVRNHPGARVFRNNDNPDEAFGLRVVGTGPSRNTDAATSATSLGWFFRRFVMKETVFSGNAGFVVAGMDHDSHDRPFVLPLESEYRAHIVEVGPLPSLEPWMRGHDSTLVGAGI